MINKKIKDIKGKKYNNLTAVKCVDVDGGGNSVWLFKCDCGKFTKHRGSNVWSGATKSCGCYRDKLVTTHGMSGSRFYSIWNEMRMRCVNKNNHAYDRYGGKGISVCDRWNKFENFYEDMWDSYKEHIKNYGERQTQIDRTKNKGDYTPDNCKWVTAKEQQNNKSTNVVIDYNGYSRTIAQWARHLGINYQTLWGRMFERGWSKEKALTTPVRGIKLNER